MYRFALKRLSDLFVFFLLFVLVSSCSGGEDSPSNPPIQKASTDQIVVIKPGGGPAITLSIGLPQPLFQSSAVTYTDPFGISYIYVIGGAYIDPATPDDPVRVNTVYTFQIDTNNGNVLSRRTEPLANWLPQALRGHSAVIYNNGINSAIYVIGGIGGFGFQKTIYRSVITPPLSPSVYPVLGQWAVAGYLPVEETGQASVVSENWLYVIGGVESGFPDPDCVLTKNCQGSQTTVFSNQIYGFDLTSNFSNTTAYTMPKKLFTPSAVAIPGPPNEQIWVLGGWDGTANSTAAYLFDVSNGILSPDSSPTSTLPDLYWNGVSKAVGLFLSGLDEMFLIGGVSGSLTPPDEILRRDIFSSFPSSPLDWNRETSLPQTVEYFSAASVGDNIYVFGGLVVTP